MTRISAVIWLKHCLNGLIPIQSINPCLWKSPHPVNAGAEILSGDLHWEEFPHDLRSDLHWEEFPHDLRTVPVPAGDQATSPLHDFVLQQSLDLLLQIQDSILVGRLIVQLLWLQYKKFV